MRLFFITVLALVAFAANSVLTRSALAYDQIGPGAFSAIRLVSGAVVLAVLVMARGRSKGFLRQGSILSAAFLFIYAGAFSYAYVTLDAGLGALILFGGVQITMFAGAVRQGERPPLVRWLATASGMVGLGIMFAPSGNAPAIGGVLLMLLSASAWGVYSLRGGRVTNPLQATAANFIFAAPAGILLWLLLPGAVPVSINGALLAIISGGVASGLGYAIWYATLPKLDASLAAIVQLSVPVIALGGGMLFLGESITWTFVMSTTLILGGILVAVIWPKMTK